MKCDTTKLRAAAISDRGFGLVEAVVATALFLILIVISIGPIMSSLDRLGTARLTTEAEKLAEARLESIRALDFDDVGLTVGNPSGVIPASFTVSGKTAWVIDTDIQWQGAVTGIDPANYKVVDITIKHPDGVIDPLSFSSIVAPDRLLDASNKANVTIDLNLMEPTPSGQPTPQVYLIKTNGSGTESGAIYPVSGATATQFQYPLLNPTDPNPGDPNYEMVMRLGPNLGDVEASGWHIAPNTLVSGSDTFQLFEAQILTDVLPIYRPAELEVWVEDKDTGLPINNAQLTLFNGTLTEVYTTSDGHFFVEDAYGYPLAPDTYDITVQAAGFAAETKASVVVPSGYPSPLHTETFELEVQVGSPVTFRVKESDYNIPNAIVTVPGAGSGVTDGDGRVTLIVPAGNYTASVANTAGFNNQNKNFSSPSGLVTVTLSRPSGYRAVHLRDGGTGDRWGWRERWSGDAWADVPRDSSGNGVFAVPRNEWYEVALICADDSIGWQRNKYVNSTEWVGAGGNGC